uniref:Uncharacterized protein n=1 Tax=Mola mola TaxID=94237 RepID=A0A3Q3VP93_MOLML
FPAAFPATSGCTRCGEERRGEEGRGLLSHTHYEERLPKPENAITIAVSSHILFNMDREQHIYEYDCSCSQALEAVNTRLREIYPESEELFDVVLMTNNPAYVGLRLINTINHLRELLTKGCSEMWLQAQFLNNSDIENFQIRNVGLLCSVFYLQGPLKGFLEPLGNLQKKFYGKGQRMDCPMRTYLVTARSAASSGTRAVKTLRSWGLEIDEALFLAGAPKGTMLEKIRLHIFFDD